MSYGARCAAPHLGKVILMVVGAEDLEVDVRGKKMQMTKGRRKGR